MKKQNHTIKAALLASGSFAGYNIGSGFATGLEGQQFFASWGSPWAFIGLLVAMAATALVYIPVYLTDFRKKSDEAYNVYHYYCGETIGKGMDVYICFSILTVILTMMSGAGATINQYFGIPKVVGVILLGVLCAIAALLGLEKMMHLLSYAGVVIMAFVLCAAVYLRFGRGISVFVPPEQLESYVAAGALKRINILGLSSPIFCGVASAGLLVVSGLPWAASMGSFCGSKKEAILSGALSGVIFYAAQGVVVYLNLISMESIVGEEVPILAVFQSYLPGLAVVFSCVILLAIFSTVSGRLFLLASKFDRGSRKIHLAITMAIIVAAAVGGTFIPFSDVSRFMFTVNGCLGIGLGITILLRTAAYWRKEKREGRLFRQKQENGRD